LKPCSPLKTRDQVYHPHKKNRRSCISVYFNLRVLIQETWYHKVQACVWRECCNPQSSRTSACFRSVCLVFLKVPIAVFPIWPNLFIILSNKNNRAYGKICDTGRWNCGIPNMRRRKFALCKQR
jgi:hypothetical protein